VTRNPASRRTGIGIGAGVVAVGVVAVVWWAAAAQNADDGGTAPFDPLAPISGEPSSSAQEGPTASPGRSASPTPSLTPSPIPTPRDGSAYVTWQASVDDLVVDPRTPEQLARAEEDPAAGTGPALMGLVDAGEVWIGIVQVGDVSEGPGQTALVAIDPETGEPAAGEPADATLPETVTCASALADGQAVCAWDGALHFVDPATGAEVGEAIQGPEGTSLYGADVAGDLLVAAGYGASGARALAYRADGSLAWETPIRADGCYVSDPAASSSVVITEGVARIGIGPYQGLVDLDTGRLGLAVCGRLMVASSGDVAVLAANGAEPEPPATYTDAAGTERRVADLRDAVDAVAGEFAGRSVTAVISEDDVLWLADAASGEELWRQGESLSAQSAFQGIDADRVYLGSVNGIKAVNLADGSVAWTWRPPIGVAFRAADVPAGGAVVAFTSSAITGIDPATGFEVWKIDENPHGAWYWEPGAGGGAGDRAGGEHDGATVVALGPARSVVSRLDIPSAVDDNRP
jgi:hypothetical protein